MYSSSDKLSSVSSTPPMGQTSSIQFIETALSCTTGFALSYPNPKQQWLIRKHLLSLIQDYPTFAPAMDTFNHNDGTTVNLLKASGDLHVSNNTPPIPLTIWLHENYPCMPPIVFVSSNSASLIHRDHPFVDPSGATASPYLRTWVFPPRNLTGLVHNLVKLFSCDHPFACLPAAGFTHPSLVSKMEALDRLSGMLHYDIIALLSKTEEAAEDLSKFQEELVKRGDILTSMINGLEHERTKLKDRMMELMNQADVLMNWLMVHNAKSSVATTDGNETGDDGFEAVDAESKLVIDFLAADRGIEDLVDVLDKAVEQGVVSFDVYVKQVRRLAREQFFSRAKLVKLRGPNILHWPD